MRSKDGAQVRFNLLIVEKDGKEKPDDIIDRCVAFATNALPHQGRARRGAALDLSEQVDSQNGIPDDQGRACQGLQQGVSRRLFLFHVALLLYSLQRVAKFTDVTYNHGHANGEDFGMAIFVKLMESTTIVRSRGRCCARIPHSPAPMQNPNF